MKKVPGILLLLFFFISSLTFSQNKYSKSADDAFADQQYLTALTRYQKAYSKVKNNKVERDRINLRMADCYRMMNNMKKAEIAYKRLATGKYVKTDPKVLLYYADALKTNGNYTEAINQYKIYLEKVPKDARAQLGIETCTQAMEWIKNPGKYEVKWEKKINAKDDDFAPAYADKTHNSLIFTSDREASTGKDIDNWNGKRFSDLFLARKDRKGDWLTPILADATESLNTKANDGVAKFNSRFTTMYFTRCWNEPKKKNGCGILKVSRAGTTAWGDPEWLALAGDSTTVIGHPCVTNDESTIYFSADLPGGYGGKDIWVAHKGGGKTDGKGKSSGWSRPENLGPDINSPGDELFPFIRDDSILYYSSNGLPGMGGQDIFRSVRTKDKWSKPENMKYPINSAADDFGIIFNPDEPEEGYFSSNRPGGKGGDDIYSFVVPPLLFTLQGTVTDDRTLQPVQGALVKLNGTNGKTLQYNTDEKGKYSFNKNQIAPNTTFEILVVKKDYFNEKGKETTLGLEKSKDLTRNFVLRPIPKKPVVLPDILYDLDKYDLKPQFQDSLQGLIATLDANENIVIELASHTDSRGSDERNDILSQRRAQSVVDYLITRGIDPDRMTAKGYGKRVPRVLTKDITKDGFLFKTGTVLTDSLINSLSGTPEKEAAHALNRRTEFSIVRNDYIPKSQITKAVAPKIEVVENPEENSISYTATRDGFQTTVYINGMTTQLEFSKGEKEVYISPDEAMHLLKEGSIDKTDFKGDVNKILGTGTVADKAVVTLKELKLGKNVVKNIDATVNSKIRSDMVFGENTLNKFGAYTIDDKDNKVIFNK
ncbi:MAG: OmpA family protein [Bacteroidetes bacterium]|nr:OmpA family protein [Bacteroidota bacterium]